MTDLIYDWNSSCGSCHMGDVELIDATLTEGLLSKAAWAPDGCDRIRILRGMGELGIQAAELSVEDLIHVMPDLVGGPRPICPIPTSPEAVDQVARAARMAETRAEIMLHDGPDLLACCLQARRLGIVVSFVVPDASALDSIRLAQALRRANDARVEWIHLWDPTGACTEGGVLSLIQFAQGLLGQWHSPARLAWCSGNTDSLAVFRAAAAIRAGVRRVRGTALGLGLTHCTPIDQLLVNLKLEGSWQYSTARLVEHSSEVARCLGIDLPFNYPVVGADAFRTATGVHAAAVRKASRKGDEWLADRVYSGVPARLFGAEQRIEVGPMAGRANAAAWLETHRLKPDSASIERVLAIAKKSDHTLTDLEIYLALEMI